MFILKYLWCLFWFPFLLKWSLLSFLLKLICFLVWCMCTLLCLYILAYGYIYVCVCVCMKSKKDWPPVSCMNSKHTWPQSPFKSLKRKVSIYCDMPHIPCLCPCAHVVIRGQHSGVGSLLPWCVSWRLNLGHEVGHRVPLHSEPPLQSFVHCYYYFISFGYEPNL